MQPQQTIIFKQLNCAKSKSATANFGNCITKWSSSPLFALLQEPATTTSGKLVSFPRGTQVFADGLHPRAAVLATPDLNVWAIPEHTSRDVASCLWKTNSLQFPELIIISVYSDITKDTISPELQALVQYCGSTKTPYIIGADTNSHSVLWGCIENNSRGDDYEDFIASHGIGLLNQGSLPTFQTSRASSIIDISLIHYQIHDLAHNWVIDTDDFLSDHKCISFHLNICPPPPTRVKNWQKTDWNRFSSIMQARLSPWIPPLTWTQNTLDDETNLLTETIMKAVTESTPSFVPKFRLRRYKWWNEEVVTSRHTAKIAYRKWTSTGSGEDHQAYLDARNSMKRMIKLAKLQAWQKFCTDSGSKEEGSYKELANINRILQRTVNKTLGLMRRHTGAHATSPEESIDILLDEHFPDSILPIPIPNSCEGTQLNTNYSWLSADKIRRAIKQFSPDKTAGLDGIKPKVLQHLPPVAIDRLQVLYTASMELQYVPKIWRISKAIFILKQGKEDYSQPRAWRPISLMSFAFKTLERLILWYLEETVLKEFSMHKNQHAFRKGRSTETALSDTVDILESEILRKGLAVGVFLDIEGAFDNLLPGGIIRSLQKRNTPEFLLQWFQNYLVSRDVQIDQ